MSRAFVAAAGGRGRVVLIEGPAGMGKSAVMEAARRAAGAAGLRVLSARGSQLEQEFDYGVVRQLVEPVLDAADTALQVRLLRGPAHRVPALLAPGREETGGRSSKASALVAYVRRVVRTRRDGHRVTKPAAARPTGFVTRFVTRPFS